MNWTFWGAVAVIGYTYAGYPLLIWTLSRLRPNPWKRAAIAPSVSIVMAVHNGAALIESKLRHLFALDYANVAEIIIVSDGSTDGTNELLRRERNPKLKTLFCDEQVGKAEALNRALPHASGDLVLFVDVRPWIVDGSISQLVSNFDDPRVGCAAGELSLEHAGHDASTSAIGGLYWRYEQWIRDCEGRFDSPLGVYGGFYAIRRSLFVPFPPGTILDDMYQPLSIVRQGYRSIIDLSAKVSDTWPSAAVNEFHRKVRTLAGNYQLIQLAPWLLTHSNRLLFQLFSHKLMRLAVPFLLPIVLGCSLLMARHSMFYFGFSVAQLLFYGCAFFGQKTSSSFPALARVSGAAHAFCMLNLAAAVGFYKFLFTPGPLWKIWGKPQITDASVLKGKAATTEAR